MRKVTTVETTETEHTVEWREALHRVFVDGIIVVDSYHEKRFRDRGVLDPEIWRAIVLEIQANRPLGENEFRATGGETIWRASIVGDTVRFKNLSPLGGNDWAVCMRDIWSYQPTEKVKFAKAFWEKHRPRTRADVHRDIMALHDEVKAQYEVFERAMAEINAINERRAVLDAEYDELSKAGEK